MNLQQFKTQRNELIAKLVILAIQINEQGKYYADCDVAGHVNWLKCSVTKPKPYDSTDLNEVFDSLTHPFTSCGKKMYHGYEGAYKDGEALYKATITDLQATYKKMSKFLEQ